MEPQRTMGERETVWKRRKRERESPAIWERKRGERKRYHVGARERRWERKERRLDGVG